MSETQLEMNLLENAFDFLEQAAKCLQRAKSKSSKDYKYAILHLSSGVELLLKQRLYNEHWSLIFADVNQADKDKLDTGEFKSVYLDEAMKRLENICKLEFSQQQREILKTLKTERNKIEHYHVSIDKAQATSLMVKTWSFALDYLAREFKLDVNSRWILQDIFRRVETLQTYVTHRHSEIRLELEEFERKGIEIRTCPGCLQPAMPFDFYETGNVVITCRFCRFGSIVT